MLKYNKVQGSQVEKPLTIDTKSSATIVYIRKNIARIEKELQSGEKVKIWEYDEAQLTKEQYVDYLTDQLLKTQEVVDYLLMNGGA